MRNKAHLVSEEYLSSYQLENRNLSMACVSPESYHEICRDSNDVGVCACDNCTFIATTDVLNPLRLSLVHLRTGCHRTLALLCNNGAEVDRKDLFGNTPLHHIINSTHSSDVVQLLVDHKADVNATNIRRCTPLHNACIRLQPPVIESLLRNKANVNEMDAFGSTPLHYAVLYQLLPFETYGPLAEELSSMARQGSTNLSRWRNKNLGKLCAVLDQPRVNGCTRNMPNEDQLYYYISCRLWAIDATVLNNSSSAKPDEDSHVAMVTSLLEGGANVLARDHVGRTPLHIAASLGYDKLAIVLMSFRADPDALDLLSITPLRLAVDSAQHAIINLMIENSANVHIVDVLGDSALHAAVRQNDLLAVQACVKSGADVNLQNKHGNTPLYGLSNVDCRHVLEYMATDGKANLNVCNWLGQTALHDAVLRGPDAVDLVEHLLRMGADPNVADSYGNTCLHLALKCEIGSVLLRYAAEVNAKNKRGLTPLHMACMESETTEPDFTWIKCLLEAGAQVNARDLYGATPAHYLATCAKDDQYVVIFELFNTYQAQFDARITVSQKSPLHLLSENSHATESLLTFLIGVTETSSCDSLGKTWAHYLAERSISSLFERMSLSIEYSSVEHKRDVCGLTPALIHVGAQSNVGPTLLENDHIYDTDSFGKTILSLCFKSTLQAHSTNADIMQKLRKLGSYKDFLGRNFLHHWSVWIGTCGVSCETLREMFSDYINERDTFGRTPLFYAALHSNTDFGALLLEAGADRSLGDENNVLPFEVMRKLDYLPALKPDSHSACTNVVNMYMVHNSHNSILIKDGNVSEYLQEKWRMQQEWKPDIEDDNFNRACVTEFVENVMSEVAKIDRRFESSQILVGSAYQETRASFPGDYDFLIVLKATENTKWHAEVSQQFPGNGRLETDDRDFDEFLDESRTLQPDLLKDKLYCLLLNVINRPDVWKSGSFEYLKVKLVNKMRSPAIAMTLFQNPMWHNGKLIVCHHEISVDFVLAIRTDFQLPENTTFSQYLAENDYSGADRGAFALMKSPKSSFASQQNGLCTLTFVRLESEIIRRSSTAIKVAYMMVCGLVPKSFSVQKYMIQTCLLHCIVRDAFCHVASGSDTDTERAEAIFECFNIILTDVVKAVISDAVESVSCPGRLLPVWGFEPSAKFSERYLQRFGMSYIAGFKHTRSETAEETRQINLTRSAIVKTGERLRHVFTDPDNATLETIGKIHAGSKRLRDIFCQLMGMIPEYFDGWIDELTGLENCADDDDDTSLPVASTARSDVCPTVDHLTEVDPNRFDKLPVLYDYEQGLSYDFSGFWYSKSPFKLIGDYTLL